MNIKLLLDENLSPWVAETLCKEDGLDAVHVRERALLDADDRIIMDRAYTEDRIVVTCNVDDFVRFAHARELHPGMILVEEGDLLRPEQLQVVRHAVAALRAERDLVNRVLRIWFDGTAIFEDTSVDLSAMESAPVATSGPGLESAAKASSVDASSVLAVAPSLASRPAAASELGPSSDASDGVPTPLLEPLFPPLDPPPLDDDPEVPLSAEPSAAASPSADTCADPPHPLASARASALAT